MPSVTASAGHLGTPARTSSNRHLPQLRGLPRHFLMLEDLFKGNNIAQ